MATEPYTGFIQRYNMMIGVLTCALITSVLFLVMPSGIFFMADMFLVMGCCIGLYLTFKNRKESQTHIKTGLIVGLTGSFLALLMISFFIWILYSLELGFNIIIFLEYILGFFLYYGIMYALVGIIVGYLFGNHYKKKEDPAKKTPYYKK